MKNLNTKKGKLSFIPTCGSKVIKASVGGGRTNIGEKGAVPDEGEA